MNPRAFRIARLVLLSALCTAAAGQDLAAGGASVRGWAHSEFGRLVFEWGAPVKHEAALVNGRLRIRFSRPIDASLSRAHLALSDYVGNLWLSPDRRTVTATVKGRYKLRSLAEGNIVIVDLVRGKETPPARARGSESIPNLPVRSGDHKRYGRLVFDWKLPVAYRVRKAGDKLHIRFDRRARIDVDRLSRSLPSQLRGLEVRAKNRRLSLRLDVDPSARIRHFRDGTKVVVDVIGSRLEGENPIAASRTRTKSRPKAAKSARLESPPMPRPKPSGPGASAPFETSSLPSIAAAGRAKKPLPAVAEKTFRPLISVDAARKGSGLILKFNWREETAAAIYRRGDRLWLLFDRPARMDLGAIKVLGRTVIEDAGQIDRSDASWLRLIVPRDVHASVRRQATAWIVELGWVPVHAKASKGVAVLAQPHAATGSRVRIEFRAKAPDFHVVDPDIGDELHLFPTRDTGVALGRSRRFAEFNLLRSLAGIVLSKRSDTLIVSRKEDAIHITSSDGLILSSADDMKNGAQPAGIARGRDKLERPLSNIRAWRRGTGTNIARTQQRLIERIVGSSGPERNSRRMDLARFYLAHELPGAALAVLTTIQREESSYKRDRDFRAMRGAARYLLGHYGEASADLGSSQLRRDASVAPWLAAISAAKGDWKNAHRLFADAEAIVSDYPFRLATHFQLLAAEASLAVGDLKLAQRRLEVLAHAPVTSSDRQRVDLLRAFLMKKSGKPRLALALWRKLVKGDDRKVRAKAAFAETETLLEQKKIDVSQAIDRFERLTFAWRGDSFEFDILRRLGELHTRQNNHRGALTRYRQAASYFGKVRGAEVIAQRMTELFSGLYLEGGADGLPAVRALALYEEFRELTPAGEAGDRLIRRLADRLASVDLLDQAGQLLDHQVRFRLEGAEKARVGARLAEIRLLDVNAKLALKALDASEAGGLPAGLQQRRRLLRARALNGLGRPTQALALLQGDASTDAGLLRLEVHWSRNDWPKVGAVIEGLLRDIGPDNLDKAEIRLILQWAVALALSNDSKGMTALRRRFAAAMRSGPYAAAFEAIGGQRAINAGDFRTLVRKSGDPAKFEAFMTAYRKQARESRLSARR